MSGYDGVVGGKLKLKGKPLDVKSGGIKKKKKKSKDYENNLAIIDGEKSFVSNDVLDADPKAPDETDNAVAETQSPYEDHRTAAEKRYEEQRDRLDVRKLAELARKSHRQRIEEFNQNLANLSEHYDIPKVGPG